MARAPPNRFPLISLVVAFLRNRPLLVLNTSQSYILCTRALASRLGLVPGPGRPLLCLSCYPPGPVPPPPRRVQFAYMSLVWPQHFRLTSLRGAFPVCSVLAPVLHKSQTHRPAIGVFFVVYIGVPLLVTSFVLVLADL